MRTLPLLAALLVSASVWAQDFPARPVHLIVPYTPGTGADILARLIGPKLGERWKLGVVTDNKPGATGNIGIELAAKAAPDGHTLVFVATSFGTIPALHKNLPFDPVKSFSPIVLLATSGLVLVVHPQVQAQTMTQFIALAKSQPGKMHYSSPGNGGPQHLAMELLKLETGIDIVHVPYKSAGSALADVVAGHVQAMISAVQTAYPQVQAGRLRALGSMSKERSPAYRDVPTMKEQGVPVPEVETWYAAFAPAGTPPGVIARINREVNEILKEASIRENLEKQGMAPAGGSPERLAERLATELPRWDGVVSAAGIKAD